MDRPELPARHIGDTLKLQHRFAIENRFSLFVPEALDHLMAMLICRTVTGKQHTPCRLFFTIQKTVWPL
jgi:hypothetical protein